MAPAWRTRRRERYGPRQHDTHSQRDRVGASEVASITTIVPDEVAWKVCPGELEAHAYSLTAGWMRSACRRERWSVLWTDAPDDAPRCFECADLVAGEIPELELRAMDGDR